MPSSSVPPEALDHFKSSTATVAVGMPFPRPARLAPPCELRARGLGRPNERWPLWVPVMQDLREAGIAGDMTRGCPSVYIFTGNMSFPSKG